MQEVDAVHQVVAGIRRRQALGRALGGGMRGPGACQGWGGEWGLREWGGWVGEVGWGWGRGWGVRGDEWMASKQQGEMHVQVVQSRGRCIQQ